MSQLALAQAGRDSIAFIARHWLILLIKLAPILAYIFIGSLAMAEYELPQSYRAFYLLGFAALYPAIMVSLIRYMANATGSNLQTQISAALWHQLFVLFLISQAITTLGYLLMILPGVYLGIRLGLAELFIIVKGQKWAEALKSSWHVTEPHQWQLMASAGTLMVLALLIDVRLLECRENYCLDYWQIEAINTATSALLMMLLSVFYYRIFTLIKAH